MSTISPYATHEALVSSTADIAARYKLVLAPESKTTERGELMRAFQTRLNASRTKAGYKPLTMARLGKIFEGRDVAWMYWLYKECLNARSFGAMFNHLTKKK